MEDLKYHYEVRANGLGEVGFRSKTCYPKWVARLG